MGCDNDHVVANLNGILSSWNSDSPLTCKAANKKIVFQIQFGKWNSHNRRIITNDKFKRFRLIVKPGTRQTSAPRLLVFSTFMMGAPSGIQTMLLMPRRVAASATPS